MKVWTLIENTACSPDFKAEHGLSLYIETGEKRILFDVGQTEAFADNAEKLGIDLGTVDFVILSHGHYDHGGGLKRFLELNHTAPVYMSRHALEPHYNAKGKYIGLDLAIMDCNRLIFTEDALSLGDGMTLYTCNQRLRPYPTEPYGLTVLEQGVLLLEDFRHEQYLLIEENGKTVCFSGCSHKGILNIVRWFQPDVLVGGFHFKQLDPEGAGASVLNNAANALLEHHAVYHTGHCTGTAQYDYMKQIMGDRLHSLSSGSCLEI